METSSGDGSEMGSVMKKKGKKFMTSIGAILTPDYRDKEERNNIYNNILSHGYLQQKLFLFHVIITDVVSSEF